MNINYYWLLKNPNRVVQLQLIVFCFLITNTEVQAQRISSYLFNDYQVGGGITMAYLTDATLDINYLIGLKFTSEAQRRHKISYTFQASYFQPITKEIMVPVGTSNPDNDHVDLSYSKAIVSQTYSNFSFGRKYYLTGSFREKNSIYAIWDCGLGFGKNKFVIENFNPRNQQSPYIEAYNYRRSILFFGAAGFGFRKKVDNHEFFWEFKGHYFVETLYLVDKYDSYQEDDILKRKVLVKSIPNYYAINFGARIFI